MSFKCHPNCKSDCCGPVIMPKEIWERNKDKAQRPLKEFFELDKGACVPATEDLKCIFLNAEGKCAIYDDRPQVCKDYGIIPGLPCPWMKPNGHPWSPAKQRQVQRKIDHDVDNNLEQMHKRVLASEQKHAELMQQIIANNKVFY